MHRRHIPAAAAAAALLVPAQALAQPAAAGRLQAIQSAGRIRIGTTGDFNPMSFRDPATRSYRGHQIEAAEQLARDMGVRAEFVATDWRTLISGLQADQYDVVFTGTSMSVARALAASFTIPWGRTGFIPLTTRRNAARFANWDSLNQRGVTLATNLGTTMEQFVQQALPAATLRRVESPARDWQELLGGRVDATMSTVIEAAFLTREYPDLVALFTDQPRNPIPMAFMAPLQDPVFLNFLNAWVTIRLASGFFAELGQKWGVSA
ncbi:transporter substrate-binding domain-containing protein [Falsiroseomonas tokyonensis]|uniref:Transporter substrate-binding domain-containing protein n=1 Tax=Falsiroseomonas tokyonensis TaxID=430521 RepID=A0ABV7BRT3_9PROT|nr:transporter substrate-binding domain-containing protein [Falsiroseomonas tokyonensis]MBU8538334.1 transporter substrate-binding domain-containing protein [Falsiroseomonas tokyonensis]